MAKYDPPPPGRTSKVFSEDPGSKKWKTEHPVLLYTPEKRESDSIIIEIDTGIESWPSETSALSVVPLVKAYRRFLEKNRDYGDSGSDLGAPGQYAELHRKMGKLRRAMWEGKSLSDEPLEDVLQDMFGHILLALIYVKQNNNGGKL